MLEFEKERYIGTVPSGGGGSAVIEELNVTPTTSAQVITAPSGTDGYNPVNVGAINNQYKHVTPTIGQQVIRPDTGYDGLSYVVVSGVTSSIDSNITTGNIKKGVTILGVYGTYEGVQPSGTINITTNGNYQDVSSYKYANVNVPDKTAIGVTLDNFIKTYDYASDHWIIKPSSNESNYLNIDANGYDTIKTDALQYAFTGKYIKNADFSSITVIEARGCKCMFMNSTFGLRNSANTVNIDFSGLVTTPSSINSCFMRAFYNARRASNNVTLNIDFHNLKVLGSGGMFECFGYDENGAFPESTPYLFSNSDIVFQSLEDIGANGLWKAFSNRVISSISFPALKASGFTTQSGQFRDMILGNSNCTIHFPSNLQAVIGSWTDVTNGFGGTNTTVLFDLPATDAPSMGGGPSGGGD